MFKDTPRTPSSRNAIPASKPARSCASKAVIKRVTILPLSIHYNLPYLTTPLGFMSYSANVAFKQRRNRVQPTRSRASRATPKRATIYIFSTRYKAPYATRHPFKVMMCSAITISACRHPRVETRELTRPHGDAPNRVTILPLSTRYNFGDLRVTPPLHPKPRSRASWAGFPSLPNDTFGVVRSATKPISV